MAPVVDHRDQIERDLVAKISQALRAKQGVEGLTPADLAKDGGKGFLNFVHLVVGMDGGIDWHGRRGQWPRWHRSRAGSPRPCARCWPKLNTISAAIMGAGEG